MKKNLVRSCLVGLLLILSTSPNLLAIGGNPGVAMPESVIPVAFPDVELEIIGINIPDDLIPEVTFSIANNNGLPLDREGVYTDGAVETRFILAYIPIGEEQKLNYSVLNSDPGARRPSTSDRNGVYTTIEQGLYTYKFTFALPADYEMDATHTLAVVATRDLRNPWELGRYYDNQLLNFIPSDSGVPIPRDVVATATCNRCHDPLGEHGGRYQEVAVCGQCHNPSLDAFQELDFADSVSMDAMIHRVHEEMEEGYPPYPNLNDCQVCHTGGTPSDGFPMVAGPSPTPVCDGTGRGVTTLDWAYAGNVEIRLNSADGKLFAKGGPVGSAETGKWVDDGRSFFLLDSATGDEVQELAVNTTVFGCASNPPGTFRGEAAMQHTRWMERPSRRVCGSCHEHIDWETGEGHAGGPQDNDDSCGFCHQPDSGEEYDRSVNGAHQVDYKSAQLGGVLVEILDIDDTSPGERPRVTFSLTDKNGPLDPAKLNRLRFAITGPNKDFAYYVQEDGLSNLQKTGTNWIYQFSTRMPNDAAGSYSMGVEGRIITHLDKGGDLVETEDQMQNFIVPIAVTDATPVARDKIVDDVLCENCHSNLSLHGDNRNEGTGYCQTCHRPDATDVNRRPDDALDQSIHFKYMVHKIHRGEDLARGYVVYGYGNSKHDYSDGEYPGDLRNCEACHVGDSYTLPLPAGRLDTVAPQDFWSPMMPEAAACLSCHDGVAAAAHAANNTGDFGEACAACHGEDRTFSVEEVHSR